MRRSVMLFDWVMRVAFTFFFVATLFVLVQKESKLHVVAPFFWFVVLSSLFIVGETLRRWKTNRPARVSWFTLSSGAMALAAFIITAERLCGYYFLMHIPSVIVAANVLWAISFALFWKWWGVFRKNSPHDVDPSE